MFESMKEFAARIGLTYSAVRLMCIKGQLPYVLIGNNRRMIPINEGLAALEAMIVPAQQMAGKNDGKNTN